jgi:hypothetical protein
MTEPRSMTPITLNVLVHACTSTLPHPNRGMPAVEETIRSLICLGAIGMAQQPNCIQATPMGQAWLKALCAVPPPRRAWVGLNGAIYSVEEDS